MQGFVCHFRFHFRHIRFIFLLIFTNLASVEQISFTIPDNIYGFLFMKGGSWFTCESFIHIVWRVI